MKTRVFVAVVASLSIFGGSVYAQPNERQRQTKRAQADDQYEYVLVTGSLIPRKVKVLKHGTNTPDAVSVYDQHDIRNSGRATTGQALTTLDPSLSMRRH